MLEGKEKFAKTVVKMGFNPAADVLVEEQGCDLMWWELSQIKGVSVYQLGCRSITVPN
jgi:hypothetical protein